MPGVLYINEYSLRPAQMVETLLRLPGRAAGKQSIEIGSEGAVSDPMGSGVRVVKLTPTCDCFVDIGPKAQAERGLDWLPAGVVQEFEVSPGDLISVVEDD